MRSLKIFVGLAALAVVGFSADVIRADLILSVNIVDPDGAYTSFHPVLASHAHASAKLWGAHFAGSTHLELDILFKNNFPRATGRSSVSREVAVRNGFYIAEQGVATEIRTGFDPTPNGSDVEFTFNTSYLQNELWFDPNPFARTAQMPFNKTDAMSVFLHEFGHAIAFNGWQHDTNGTYVDQWRSTFDELKTFENGNYYFNGPRATSLYGGPVPVTHGNVNHLGNASPGPGEDLIPDLMNGVVFYHGTRYHISEMDLAIIADTGLNVVSTPEPSAVTLVLLAGIGYVCRSRFRFRSRAEDAEQLAV